MVDAGLYLQLLMSTRLSKIYVPTSFHSGAQVVEEMLENDKTGIVDSMTDFMVESAEVNFSINSSNDKYNSTMKKWLDLVNIEYNGLIVPGINALASEYFKERWKGASFPVMKIMKWDSIDGIILPTKVVMLQGSSIYAEDKDTKSKDLKLLNYDYYLGDIIKSANANKSLNRNQEQLVAIVPGRKHKLNKDVIFSKPYGRQFDPYPKIFLIKRGIYYNWKVAELVKKFQTDVLTQIIPYIFQIQKGSEALAVKGIKTYGDPELKELIKDFQKMYDEMKTNGALGVKGKSTIRATMYDEELKHLIPDLKSAMDRQLLITSERGLLSGFGLTDIMEATDSNRKETIMNPRGFQEEVKKGADDFKNIFLNGLIYKAKQVNKTIKDFQASVFTPDRTTIQAFLTDKFRGRIKELYDRGRLSSKTTVDMIGGRDIEIEKEYRKIEDKENMQREMAPVVTQAFDEKNKDTNKVKNIEKEEKLSDDKKGQEAKQYDVGKVELDIEASPYFSVKDLPKHVKQKFNITKQRAWMSIFNSAYYFYLAKYDGDEKKAEGVATQVANEKIKNVKKK